MTETTKQNKTHSYEGKKFSPPPQTDGNFRITKLAIP